jgi:hypothetical protein
VPNVHYHPPELQDFRQAIGDHGMRLSTDERHRATLFPSALTCPHVTGDPPPPYCCSTGSPFPDAAPPKSCATSRPPASRCWLHHRADCARGDRVLGACRAGQREQAKPLQPWAVVRVGHRIPGTMASGSEASPPAFKPFPFPLICFNIHIKWLELLKIMENRLKLLKI